MKLLYSTERGYAIHRNEKHWRELYDWPKEVELPNELVPIRPLLCTIIWNVVRATETFAQVLERTIQLPEPLFPGLRFYSRGYYDRELDEIPHVMHNSWWCDAEATPKLAIDPPVQSPVDDTQARNASSTSERA